MLKAVRLTISFFNPLKAIYGLVMIEFGGAILVTIVAFMYLYKVLYKDSFDSY